MRVPPIISGLGKATNFKFGRYIQSVHANKSPLKIWENREHGRIQGLPKFLENPLLSQEWVKLRTSKLADIFRGSIRTKALYKFGRIGSVGESRDFPNFGSTPITSGMGKATNFKFCRYIQKVHTNKSRLKIWEKLERGRIQGLPKFFEYPLLSQERIKLRTSTFVCIFLVSIGTKDLYKFREK